MILVTPVSYQMAHHSYMEVLVTPKAEAELLKRGGQAAIDYIPAIS